ncbi:MAG TPA: LamG-like jellyroll fold domain-containing protein, partial [Candidatus Nitrosotalea sp.]|nr:LamG-like jellyroll fold domain-containing protein [Candidatus Nitrosotalea sp.]
MRQSVVIMLIVIIGGSVIYDMLMPKSYGYQNESDDKSNVMQEIFGWNFSNLNPNAIIFGNTIRVMEGPSGHSLKFDGKNDFVRVTSSIAGQVHDLTVSSWVKPDYNLTSKQFTIIDKPESFSLYLKSDGSTYHAVFSVYAGAKWYSVESKKPIDAHWTKLLGVFDGRFIGIYVDDTIDSFDLVQAPTISDLFPIVYSDISSSDVLVGASANGSVIDNFFSGQIDEVQVLPSDGYLLDVAENQSTQANITSTIPSNVTAQANITSTIPSNVPKPIRYYGFNLNSVLPENMVKNATIVSNGIIGTALQLTGGYITENIPETNQLSNLSLSVWVHPDYSAGKRTFTIVSKADSFLLQIQNIATDQGTASFSIFDGISWHTVESKAKIPIGWTHLATTFNGSVIDIYVNGNLDSSQPVSKLGISESGQIQSSSISNLNSNSDVLIGSQLETSGTTNHFNGLIDELSIYDKYLDSTQINGMFESTVQSTGYTPVAIIPVVIPENLTTTSIPTPVAALNFSINLQNTSKTFGGVSISPSGVNGSSLELSGRGFISQTMNSTNQISSLTISAWVKPNYQTGSAEYTVLSKQNSFLLTIHNNIPPKKAVSFSMFDGISWHTVESKSKIPEKWTYIAATFNGTSIGIYVNGINEGNQSVSSLGISISGQLETKTTQNLKSSADILIGAQRATTRDQTTFQSMFGGNIDEVHVYKSVLSPSEIYEEYLKNAFTVNELQSTSATTNATIPLNATTVVQPVQSNSTLPITLSVKKYKTSYLMTEKPEFDFEFISSKVLQKYGKSIREFMGEQQTGRWVDKNGTINVDVIDPNGKKVPVSVNFTKLRDGKFNIRLGSERAGKAGTYTVRITLDEGGKTYTTESTYAWGLVSLNTEKSIYRPSEYANFTIVVLDNAGHSVCNSNIVMNIKDPTFVTTSFSTGNGITANPECGLYDAAYLVPISGNYTVNITATNPSGIANFTSSFLAANSFPFEIIRTAQSKIDPFGLPNNFNVKINVKSFTGTGPVTIKEYVSSVFNVTTDGNVNQTGNVKVITWQRNLDSSNSTVVSYDYSVPLVAPELYALGKVEVVQNGADTFTEARNWFVAVDPGGNSIIFNAPMITNDASISSSTVVADWCTGTCTPTLAGGTGQNTVTKSSLGSASSTKVNSGTVVHFIWITSPTISDTWKTSTCSTGTCTSANPTSFTMPNAVETVTANYLASRSLTETLTSSDAVSKTHVAIRSLTETLTSSDTISSNKVSQKSLSDSLSTSDAISTTASINRSLSDSVSMTDSIIKFDTKSLSDSILLSDTKTSSATRIKSLSDNLSITDSESTSSTKIKSLSDSISAIDSTGTSSIKTKSLSDTVSLSDSVSTKHVATKSLSDSLALSDSVSATKSAKQSLSDSLTLSDSISTKHVATKSLSDSLALSDSVSATKSAKQSLSDSLTLSD